jgi:hypothetical protein
VNNSKQKALLNGPQYTIRIKPSLGGIGSQGKNMNNPGPGQYQQDSAAINKTIAYTFGMKTGSSLRPGSAHVPGPGQYNTLTERKTSLGGFGTEKRETGGVSKGAAIVPGPGQYFSNHGLGGPAIGFGSSKRGELGSSTARVPGPG